MSDIDLIDRLRAGQSLGDHWSGEADKLMAGAAARIEELEAQVADLERIRSLMARDWFDFCETMNVTPDTQEAVASELKTRVNQMEVGGAKPS